MAFLIGLALAISDGPRLAQLAGPQHGGKQEKRIDRGSLKDALKTVLDLRRKGEEITDSEQLNVEGARYIFSMYKRFGVV